MDVSLAEDVAERTWEAIERVRATEALRDSEERLRFALSGGQCRRVGIWTLRREKASGPSTLWGL